MQFQISIVFVCLVLLCNTFFSYGANVCAIDPENSLNKNFVQATSFKTTCAQDNTFFFLENSNINLLKQHKLLSCPEPDNILISSITASSATISWSNAAVVEIDYAIGAHTPGSGTILTGVSTSPFLISGLASASDYYFYLRQDCGAGLYSTWAGPFQFTTDCPVYTAPFHEPFTLTTIPDCWSMSGPQQWLFTTSWPNYGAQNLADHTFGGGTHFAGVDGSGNAGLTNITLITPLIDVSAMGSPRLRFFLFNNNIDDNSYQTLSVDFFDGAQWNNSVYYWGPADNAPDWQEVIVYLSSYNITGPVQFRFVVNKSAGDPHYDDIIIDDVIVEESPSCPSPSNLSTDSIAVDAAVLSWTENGNALSWDIEFGLSGFVPTGLPSQTGVTNPYLYGGLTVNTDYDYYVRSVCGIENSTWVGPFSFRTRLCEDDDQCVYTFVLLDGYADGWNGATMQVKQDNFVIATLGSGFTNGSSQNVAVPLCHGFDFEVYWNNAGSYPEECGLMILDVFGGVLYNNQIIGSSSVGTVIYSGITDCSIPSCLKPINVSVTQITSNSAVVSWTEPGTALSWELQYGESGFNLGDGTILSSVTNSQLISGLIGQTQYEYYVRSFCDPEYSAWAGPYTFQTRCDPFELPFQENFEYFSSTIDCWVSYDMDGMMPSWELNEDRNHTVSGAQSVFHDLSPSTTQNGYFVSPPIIVPDVIPSELSFWSSNNWTNSYSNGKNSVLISSGSSNPMDNQFTEVWTTPTVSSGWVNTIISLNNYAGDTIYIAFRYEGLDAHQWWVDDVEVYKVFDYDVEPVGIDFEDIVLVGSATPSATVKNNGMYPASFDVMMEIGNYTSTKTVASLSPNDSISVVFDPWTNQAGIYSVIVTTLQMNDQEPNNNELSKNIRVMEIPDKDVYAYIRYVGSASDPAGPASFSLQDPGDLSSISAQWLLNPLNSGSWANGQWYATVWAGSSPSPLVTVDLTTGARTVIGNTVANMNGISYNVNDNTMYGVAYDNSTYFSKLYTIDLLTGSSTLIGDVAQGTLVNLAIDGAGNAYTLNVSTNMLHQIDLSTGTSTIIGNVEFDAASAQDMEFDRETGELYMAAYDLYQGGFLGWVDLNTGAVLKIGSFEGNAQISGFAIPYLETKTLTLNVLLESLYSGNGSMNQAMGTSGPEFPGNVADLITVELRQSLSPYDVMFEYQDVNLYTDGTATISNLPGSLSGEYFLAIKHRNSIETWSAQPVNFSGAGPISYSFTSAAAQAYGNNQKLGSPGYYVIWGGDANQDGLIDGSDMSSVENAANNFLQGYLLQDVNGDGLVDGSDLLLIDNNAMNFIQVIRP